MSERLLENRLALVTGAGRGIGLAIARKFAGAGAQVVLNSRTSGALEGLCQEMSEEFKVECTAAYFDVSDAEAVKTEIASIHKQYKRLDVLVNNAGILRDSLFAMTSVGAMQEVIETNVLGSMYCAQLSSRLMARQSSGSIINISSIIGVVGNEGQVVYGASKAAIIGMTKSLAKEIGGQNVRVNAIAPGFIDTDMIKDVPEAKSLKIKENIKMGRLGVPDDIANTALFLASDLSSYVTGQVIGVDGGMMI